MKLHFLHKDLKSNIKVSLHESERFKELWHYHPELELVYIVRGEGTLYAGDFIGDFKSDDIFLLGKNVPHMFYSNTSGEIKMLSKAYVIYLNDAFLNNLNMEQGEFHYLENLLKISKRGVLFRSPENHRMLQILNKMPEKSLTEKALNTLLILYFLSGADGRSLGSPHWLEHFHVSDKRLNEVIEYIMLHFKEEIGLEKVAGISGMNKTAFCRYFKQNTGKSFVTFLNELRINYSCKLLKEINPSNSVSVACYNSGFNSLSYFNRTFKKITGMSPSQYQADKELLPH
ncbi:MAG TPA: AraC family transcriptional regulator [Salinimicrobium sp.]|nr:AraC family transcriptional regulator [Salinimicrobium sp.]